MSQVEIENENDVDGDFPDKGAHTLARCKVGGALFTELLEGSPEVSILSLGEELGLTRSTAYNWRDGKSYVEPRHFPKIAKMFGLHASALWVMWGHIPMGLHRKLVDLKSARALAEIVDELDRLGPDEWDKVIRYLKRANKGD